MYTIRIKVTKENIGKIRDSLDYVSLTLTLERLERKHIKKHFPKTEN